MASHADTWPEGCVPRGWSGGDPAQEPDEPSTFEGLDYEDPATTLAQIEAEVAADPSEARHAGCANRHDFVDRLFERFPEAIPYFFAGAATHGHVALVERLLARGVSPDTPVSSVGSTALMIAAIDADLAMIEALYKAGADPHVRALDRVALEFARLDHIRDRLSDMMRERKAGA